jgi:aspartate dehydrogenase
LSLAGIGSEKTRVKVFVDPKASRNIHEITVEGDFGKFTCRIENVPSPENPKTSFLAALSAIATLKKITEPLQIGT